MIKNTLLLVDDHAVVREGIRNALLLMDQVEVIGELGDGKALFNFLAHTVPDCLLIDITMPHFEPITDIGKIRREYPDMKILVVSAYDDDVYVQGLLGLGVNGYHLKDQSLEDLRMAVHRVLKGERWVSSRLVDRLLNKKTDKPVIPQLTPRQRDILRLLHQGLTNRNIAQELKLSVRTIENHLTRVYRQISVSSRLEAVSFIMKNPEILAIYGENKSRSFPEPQHRNSRDTAILVIDDNHRYRQQLVKMIRAINPRLVIYECSNIEQSLIYAQQIKPYLIFIDVILGEENGIQCVKSIRRVSSDSRMVLISAYPDSEFHRQGLNAGALAFLDKKNLGSATLQQIMEDLGIA